MNTKEILMAARAKIEKPENWCQGAIAKNKDGRIVLPENNEAAQWCMLGALDAACGAGAEYDKAYKAPDKRIRCRAVGGIQRQPFSRCRARYIRRGYSLVSLRGP